MFLGRNTTTMLCHHVPWVEHHTTNSEHICLLWAQAWREPVHASLAVLELLLLLGAQLP